MYRGVGRRLAITLMFQKPMTQNELEYGAIKRRERGEGVSCGGVKFDA